MLFACGPTTHAPALIELGVIPGAQGSGTQVAFDAPVTSTPASEPVPPSASVPASESRPASDPASPSDPESGSCPESESLPPSDAEPSGDPSGTDPERSGPQPANTAKVIAAINACWRERTSTNMGPTSERAG